MQFVRKPKLLLPIILIFAIIVYVPSITNTAHGATGTVCLIDTSSSSCPASPAPLTGTVGTKLRVSVFLQGSDHINGFDITILANHTILNPAGVDLNGTILPGPPTILVHCDSGVLKTGGTCSPTDTLDTIHLAVVGPAGQLSATTTGLLFTAIYNVTGSTSGIPVGFQTGCSNTSVPPNTCVTVSNGSPIPVSETVQTATFSTSTSPDFALTANPTSLTITAGASGVSTLNIASFNGFSGSVTLSATITPTGPGLSLNPNNVVLSSGQTLTSDLTVSTTSLTPPGAYTVTETGTSGSLTHSTTITLTVNAPPQPDFTISANPTSLTVQPGSSASSQITIASLNGFTGTVNLSTTPPPLCPNCPSWGLSPTSVTLSSGGTGTATFTFTSVAGGPTGTFNVNVTGTSGPLSHSTTISATVTSPPQPDFSISASQQSITILPGTSATSTITITAINGFMGTVTLSVVASSGLAATINPTSVTNSGTATLTVTSNAVGSYSAVVTGTSGTLSHSVTVFVTVPLVGEVCIIGQGTTSCPSNTLSFSGTAGDNLTVTVFIQNSGSLNGFDVTLLADRNMLQPMDASLSGTVLPGTPTILLKCIDGVFIQGTTCSPTDVGGTVHLAAVGSQGMLTTQPTTGLLFTATYRILTTTSGTIISFQTGCSRSSIGGGVCVTISNGSPLPVPETIPSGPNPSFSISTSPTSLTLTRGSSGTATITLASIAGFTGTVSLSGTISPNTRHGPTATLSATAVTLSSGGTGSVILTISTTKHTPAGSYTVTINAVSGSLSQSITIAVTVK